jgi:hypothetical protein
MAQYLQKTDSQEFAVANADQDPGRWNENVRDENATDVTVRVWGADGLGEPGPITWRADSVFVYMIADLVVASRGTLAEELPGVMAAHFNNSSQALVAAKRIQTCILEFLAGRPGQGFGAAILIHPRATSYASQREFVQRALGQASPGQILLAADVYRGLRNLPGAEFRIVEPLASVPGDRQTGLTEFIWKSPEHDAAGYSSADRSVEAYSEQNRPPIGATRIVDSPFRKPEKWVGSTGEPPITRSAELASVEHGEHAGQPPDEFARPQEMRSATREFADTSSGNLLVEELEAAARRRKVRTQVLLGVAAVVVVGALVAAFYHAPSPANPPAASQQQATQPTGNAADGVKPAEPSEPATLPPNPPAADSNSQPATKPLKVERKTHEKPPEKSPAQTDVTSVDNFFPKDVPMLLQMAQSAYESGDSGKAEYDYKTVLRLQPNNPDALQGLHKLDLIRNEHKQ